MAESDTPALPMASTILECPNPYTVDYGRTLPEGYQILCGCPGEGEARPRHWVVSGAQFFCRCAPHEIPERGAGLWVTGNPDGYACSSCRRRLPGRTLMRPLVCDMWCCWCGGLAEGNWGYRIHGHPAWEPAA